MLEVQLTKRFSMWLDSLRDGRARAAVLARLNRLGLGNFGDAKSVGEGVSELRINVGPGYRAYYLRSGRTLVVMLCGGDKSTQSADIKLAKTIARELTTTEPRRRT